MSIVDSIRDARRAFGGDGVFNSAGFGLAWYRALGLRGAPDGIVVAAILRERADVEPLSGGAHWRHHDGWWARLLWRLSSDSCQGCESRVRRVVTLAYSRRISAYCPCCEREMGITSRRLGDEPACHYPPREGRDEWPRADVPPMWWDEGDAP